MLRVFHVEHCYREVGKLFNQSCALRLFAFTIREFSHISPPDVTNESDSKGNDRVRPTRCQSRFAPMRVQKWNAVTEILFLHIGRDFR
jgi:hypothetical protein